MDTTRFSLLFSTMLLMFGSMTLAAQPRIAYIMPDIGAENMNTAVEIIAEHDATSTFGTDGIYANNPGDPVRVEPTGPRAADLVVGPLVVSWNGRLISTQVFVRPNAPNGTIQLRVTSPAGQATVPFEIVTPISSVNNPGAGALGSGGGYGSRSKRGAMIVERLILTDGATSSVSTTDPDGSTPGNQGYLPMIIIARELVSIRLNQIDVSGNGKHAGPGGGGGGGQNCDSRPIGGGGREGAAGGDGYTGGGGGGRNGAGSSAGSGDNRSKPAGAGSGSGGGGLSGVAAAFGSADCTNPEGAGGGTGHPFGRGGQNGCVGYLGYYGGGSSGASEAGGGGGGYANNGVNATGGSTGDSRGKAHGNTQIVPFAGGSGGASGNPGGFNLSGNCSGEGGGAGGAIAIYSMDNFTSQGTIISNGADGTNTDGNAGGGGGSGGAIIIGAKQISTGVRAIGAHQLAGGTGPRNGGNGAAGRFRFDGFLNNPPGNVTAGASNYTGPSTDTLTFAQGYDFTLRGTRSSTRNIRVYMKSGTADWQLLPGPTYVGREWTLNITAPDTGYHYVAALQQGGGGGGSFTAEPSWVHSQVAANIVRVESVPRIDTIGRSGNVGNGGKCPKIQPHIPLFFRSTGTENLNVRTEIRNQSTPGVWSVTDPAGIDSPGGLNFPPDPLDSHAITVTADAPAGVHTAELLVITNDPRTGFDTIVIPLRFEIDRNEIELLQDTLDFGKICINTDKYDSVKIRYSGVSGQFNVDDIRPNRFPPFTKVSPADGDEPKFFNPSLDPSYDSLYNIRIRFLPVAVGQYFDSLLIEDECGRIKVLYIKGEGIEEEIEWSDATGINFGQVLVGRSVQRSIWIRNTGESPVIIDAESFIPPLAQFRLVSPSPIGGTTIPPNDSIEIVIEFTPDEIGVLVRNQFDVEFRGPCANLAPVGITGIGVNICLIGSVDTLVFIADSCEVNPDPLDSTLVVENCGGVGIELLEYFSVNGTISSTLTDSVPRILPRKGSAISFKVFWDPQSGTGTDSIAVVWRDVVDGKLDTLYIPVRTQFDQAVVQLQTKSGDTIPSVVDIGGVYQCGPAQDTIVLVNAGTIEGEITASFVKGGIFDVSPSIASPYLLAVGGSQDIIITLDPANAPTPGQTYEDTLVLVNGRCNQEWRVALRSTRYTLEMSVPPVDFGATNLGLPRTQTVTFRNTTNAPPEEELTIERVYIDPPGSSPPFAVDALASPLPAQVQADSGTFDVTLSFTPSSEFIFNGRLCFEISEPCDTVICVDLKGQGIRSNIYVPQGDLTFGETYYCQEDTLGLTVFSVGPVPLDVDSIRIVGPDRAGFEIISLSQTPPVTLQAGFPAVVDSIDVLVRFIPANVAPDGVKNATLEIYSNDTAQDLIQVPLTGERTSPAVVGPALVSYGTVVVGTTSLQRLTLTNTSDDPITIAAPTTNGPFRIVTALPLVIPAKGSLDVDVEFAPTDSEIYNDTLVGLFSLPCDGELRVPLDGEGLRGETVVSIPTNLTGKPGERIAVPIILEEATALADVGATTVRVWIRFNKSMMLPVDADGGVPKRTASDGSIFLNEVDGNDRVVGLEFANSPLPTAPAPLGFVDMLVLLGDDLITGITFDSVRWVDGEVTSTSNDGEFSLNGYCDVGSNRLVRVDGDFGIKSVTPNPVGSTAEIIFETVENGATRLEMFDMAGRKVAGLVDESDLPVQAHLVVLQTEGLAAGAYTVVLTTPTQRSVKRIIVRR